MLEAWKLFTEMGFPGALALVGGVAAISIPLAVRRASRDAIRRVEIAADRDVKLSEIKGNTTALPSPARDY
jgi:hypothetical protein